jgi:hypothetical protein
MRPLGTQELGLEVGGTVCYTEASFEPSIKRERRHPYDQ